MHTRHALPTGNQPDDLMRSSAGGGGAVASGARRVPADDGVVVRFPALPARRLRVAPGRERKDVSVRHSVFVLQRIVSVTLVSLCTHIHWRFTHTLRVNHFGITSGLR